MNPNFLRAILPLSVELNNILGRILGSDPDKRITISELKGAIVGCSSFVDSSFKYQEIPESQMGSSLDYDFGDASLMRSMTRLGTVRRKD
jgi:hypothetical protein